MWEGEGIPLFCIVAEDYYALLMTTTCTWANHTINPSKTLPRFKNSIFMV